MRYALFSVDLIAREFEAELLPDLPHLNLEGSYNIAPTDVVPVVLYRDGKRRVWPVQWGLVPSWAKDYRMGGKLANARAETIAEKPSYRGAFKYRRCVIPADGFYEWRLEKGRKQPYFVSLRSRSLMGFAGVWEQWEGPEGYLETCSLITTAPNRMMAELHDRMPVILNRGEVGDWLSEGTPARVLEGMLDGYASDRMEYWAVGKEVGNPRAEGKGLIEKVECVVESGETGTLF